jgi:hypothetical protein
MKRSSHDTQRARGVGVLVAEREHPAELIDQLDVHRDQPTIAGDLGQSHPQLRIALEYRGNVSSTRTPSPTAG